LGITRVTLKENGYLLIPGFISPERAEELGNEVIRYSRSLNNKGVDTQVLESHTVYNHLHITELLVEKVGELSSIIGEPLLPTYTYSREYLHGSDLFAHTDRESCEVSVTLHLKGDSAWPFWIRDNNGKNIQVLQKPGDGLVYHGITNTHWREQYEGDSYAQSFLHYVRSRGEHRDYYGDDPDFHRQRSNFWV